MTGHRHQVADRRRRAQLQADRDVAERKVKIDQEDPCTSGRHIGTQVRGYCRLAAPPLGGCGKTTIATNLGAYVASTGARVLLIDLDLAFGDVAISLQLRPAASVGDLVAMTGHIDAVS